MHKSAFYVINNNNNNMVQQVNSVLPHDGFIDDDRPE